MSQVKKTRDGKFIVAANYDGKKLAGPFDKRDDALVAHDKCVSAVIRSTEKHGLMIIDEDTGKELDGPFRSVQAATAARNKHCKGPKPKASKGAPKDAAPDDAPEQPGDDAAA